MLPGNSQNRNGFTLIEVTVSLALLALVTLGVFSLFSYGNAAFSQGKSQNTTQSEVRLVNDYVLQTVKFATTIDMHNTMPSITADDDRDFIYVDTGRLVHSAYNDGDPRIVKQWGSGVQSGSFFWTARHENSQIFGVRTFGLEAGRQFDIESSIELPNIPLTPNHPFSEVNPAVAVSFRNNYVVEVSGNPVTPGDGSGYYVTLIAEPSTTYGSVYGDGPYGEGTIAIITAVAHDGYAFLEWWERHGDNSETKIGLAGPMYFFTVTRDITLVAKFEETESSSNPWVDFTVKIEDTSSDKNQDYRFVLTGIDSADVTVSKQSDYSYTFAGVTADPDSLTQRHELTIYRRLKNNDPWGDPLLEEHKPIVTWVDGGVTLNIKYEDGELKIADN